MISARRRGASPKHDFARQEVTSKLSRACALTQRHTCALLLSAGRQAVASERGKRCDKAERKRACSYRKPAGLRLRPERSQRLALGACSTFVRWNSDLLM